MSQECGPKVTEWWNSTVINTATVLVYTAIVGGAYKYCEEKYDDPQSVCPSTYKTLEGLVWGLFASPVISTGCFLARRILPITDHIYTLGFGLPILMAIEMGKAAGRTVNVENNVSLVDTY